MPFYDDLIDRIFGKAEELPPVKHKLLGDIALPPPPVIPRPIEEDPAALTVWAEARGEPPLGQEAVAHTIMNRARSGDFPPTPEEVVLQEKQFSAWNPGDPNLTKMESLPHDDPAYLEAKRIMEEVMAGQRPDPTGGATHYHSKSIPPPSWAPSLRKTAEIGGHVFYKPRPRRGR
jgi:spore germination cell wall hydrolase CwlJ-like protein